MTLDLIDIRRHLHQIPEIGLQEHETQALLLALIHCLCDGKPFVEVSTWRTGILVLLHGSQPHRTIGWRTDIDGLPVTEATGLPYQSRHEGQMHACGHDIHMTVALGLLERLVARQPVENFLFVFQPAEENEAGAKLMYEDGVFTGEHRPDELYALHVRPDMATGVIATNATTLFAGTCELRLTFTGESGHAAFPQTAHDALVAAAYFVTEAQTVISRSIDPVAGGVVTFGEFHAGTTNNVIAGTAELYGTIRGLSRQTISLIKKRLTAIAQGIAASFAVTADMTYREGGWLPVENNPDLAQALMAFLQAADGIDFVECPPAMTGEDFGYLTGQMPGVMVWLGVGANAPLHSPKLAPDEAAIATAVHALGDFLLAKANP